MPLELPHCVVDLAGTPLTMMPASLGYQFIGTLNTCGLEFLQGMRVQRVELVGHSLHSWLHVLVR